MSETEVKEEFYVSVSGIMLKRNNLFKIPSSLSPSNSKTFLFLKFLSKPLLKSAFRSLKWGFLTLIWNFPLIFRAIFVISAALGFSALEMEQKAKKCIRIWRRKRLWDYIFKLGVLRCQCFNFKWWCKKTVSFSIIASFNQRSL